MPRERALSEVKEPHLISLKVLRLSRPSLSEQQALPSSPNPALLEASRYSHAYHSHDINDTFIFTPLLTLPPSFGSVYIGETFSCILSANNESRVSVTGGKISAQMQTPSQTIRLSTDEEEAAAGAELQPGGSLQKIVSYDLKEEGGHTLAVTVSYTEAMQDGETRVRTFKKLYQFVAQQCIMVRTKAGPLGDGNAVLEAQLENLSEGPVTLSNVSMKTRWKATSLNWDGKKGGVPVLRSRDVVQVAFLLEPGGGEGEEKEKEGDDIGQLSIEWKTSCGDKGFLRTGKLFLPPV